MPKIHFFPSARQVSEISVSAAAARFVRPGPLSSSFSNYFLAAQITRFLTRTLESAPLLPITQFLTPSLLNRCHFVSRIFTRDVRNRGMPKSNFFLREAKFRDFSFSGRCSLCVLR